jgi:pullulanase/glycogen debranching enzyme
VKHPGTFAGVAEKVPYLKKLGVTAVELMPVMSFDDKQVMRQGPGGEPLRNYWGYSTLGFFAPEDGYCVAPEAGRSPATGSTTWTTRAAATPCAATTRSSCASSSTA